MADCRKDFAQIGLSNQPGRPAGIAEDLHPQSACGHAAAATATEGEVLLDCAARGFAVFFGRSRGLQSPRDTAMMDPLPRIRNVLVPTSILRDPDRFGGRGMGDCRQGNLLVRDGHVVGMEQAGDQTAPAGMVLPALTEPHVHLDKCHSAHRLGSVGGDLRQAITAQRKDKAHWTHADLHARASRGLTELAEAGCGAVRSHIDWSDDATAPAAFDVLGTLARTETVDLQCAALVGVDVLARPGMAEAIARVLAPRDAALGAFVLDQPEREEGVRAAFAAADRYGIALDFHVDEGLDDGLDGLALIARIALETRFEGPLLCGHGCALMNRTGRDLSRTLDLLARSGMTVAALPSTNLYLQGRGGGTPDRRGITRLAELRHAGVPIALGTDNVRDAFCPLGRHDPRATLALAVLGAHLDPPFGDHLPLITHDAARAIGREVVYVDGADVRDLRFFNAASTADLLTGDAPAQVLDQMIERSEP